MSTIVLRSVKGTPLTNTEVDDNFNNLNTDKVEKTAAAITGGSINGTTVGASTASTGAFTTLTTSSTVTHNGGTANGVAFLNASKVLTTGSALTFDGTTLGTNRFSMTGFLATFNNDNFYMEFQRSGTPFGYIGTGSNTAGGAVTDLGIRAQNNLVFAANGTEAMRLTSTGLGLGTSSPGQLIDGTAANPRLRLTATSTGYAASQMVNSSGSSYFARDNSAGSFFGIANGTIVYSSTSDPIGFYLGGSEQMRLTSTGLGIGTSSPAAKLQVVSSSGVAAAISNSDATDGFGLKITAGGSASARYALHVLDSTDSTSYFKISTETGQVGNVGIGTSSPTEKLTVNGNIKLGTSGTTWIYGPSTTGRSIYSNSDSTAYIIAYGSAYGGSNDAGLQFTAGTSNTMVFNASGNLGLGVTPSAWRSSDTVFQVGPVASLNSDTDVTTDVGYNYFYNSSNIPIYSTTAQASRYSQYLGAHRFFTAPSGTAGDAISFTQAMTLDASGNLLVGGTSLYNATITSYASATRSGGLGIRNSAGTAAGGIYSGAAGSGGGSTDVYVEGAGVLVFFAGGSERLRITSAGNVGIGTSSPWARLSLAMSNGQMGLANGNTSGGVKIQAWNAAGNADGYLAFEGYTKEYARFDSSGNLGLGTAPSAWQTALGKVIQLGTGGAIVGDSGASRLRSIANAYFDGSNWRYIANGYATYMYQDGSTGATSWQQAASGTAGDAISFSQVMTLDASGNLLLGQTSATGARLTVTSGEALNTIFTTSRASGSFLQFQLGNGGTNLGYMGSAGQLVTGGSVNNFALRAEANMVFSIADTERARITSGGDLLVGTTSAGAGVGFNTKIAVDADSGEASILKTSGGASAFCSRMWNSGSSGDNKFLQFITESSPAERGSITYNRAGGLTAYNTTSDYRAKDIIGPVTDSGALIDSTPVYMGMMKGATQERPMFIAHETPAYAHTGTKDAVDADGNPVYQQMDASALIPVMWAEIQSLRQRLAAAGI